MRVITCFLVQPTSTQIMRGPNNPLIILLSPPRPLRHSEQVWYPLRSAAASGVGKGAKGPHPRVGDVCVQVRECMCDGFAQILCWTCVCVCVCVRCGKRRSRAPRSLSKPKFRKLRVLADKESVFRKTVNIHRRVVRVRI